MRYVLFGTALLMACSSTAAPLEIGGPDAGTSSCQRREPATFGANVCPSVSAAPLDPQIAGSRRDRGPEGLASLRQSLRAHYDAWLAISASQGCGYDYVLRTNSVFGPWCQTELQVRSDRVVSRRQWEGSPEDPAGKLTFEEVGAAVGSHPGCHEPLTLDRQFARCWDEVLCQSPADNRLYLQFGNDGMLQLCTYQPLDCQDNCATGVVVTRVVFVDAAGRPTGR
jgi:hypothetical protein